MPAVEMAGFGSALSSSPVIEMAGFEPLNFDHFWRVLTDR